VSFLSEDDFLRFMDRFFPRSNNHLLLGRGDDCAILSCPQEICLSTDIFLEGVHFRRSYFSAADIGYKALAVNLSDIAAMAARPLGFALNLMFPEEIKKDFLEEMFAAMSDLAGVYSIPLVGGDLSKAPCLGLDITIWGQSSGRFLTRGGCQPGDILFILGEIGLARAGLMALEENNRDHLQPFPESVQAHLRPQIHLQKAWQLGGQKAVRGLMDVSDGLVQDLPRFTGQDLGTNISLQGQDLHPEVISFAQERGLDPLKFALLGGEDYALLGAAAKEEIPALQTILPELRPIGEVISQPGLFIANQPAKLSGFDHFQKEES
jgi:thiamine-monophosphate kinase